MEQDKVRAEFEAAMNAEAEAGGYEVDWSRSEVDAERYANPAVRSAWWGWQASRAAVVVELPPTITVEDAAEAADQDDERAVTVASMVNGAITVCGALIRSAGIRTK